MAATYPSEMRQMATCPACGYPTINASICAACSPLAMTAGHVPAR